METTDSRRLNQLYDVAMLDLDGVVYIGGAAVPGASEFLAIARQAGQKLAFVTNNASRPPEVVAEHLSNLGVPAEVSDVVTSAQAAAQVLAAKLPAGSLVSVLGGEGLYVALREVGLVPVEVDSADAVAIVNGFPPDAKWTEIMQAAVAVRNGRWWVASNTDMTIPTAFGIAPGNGELVSLIQRFSGIEPVVAGKPAAPLLDETIRRLGARRPLMVGDRLDTDIAGGSVVGVDTLLVMTGVSDLADVAAATGAERPTYIGADLDVLNVELAPVANVPGGVDVAGWSARVSPLGVLSIAGTGTIHEWWTAVAHASWAWLDETGIPVDVASVTVPHAR